MATRMDDGAILVGANGTFIAELYGRYLEEPNSVDPSWRAYFAELEEEAPSIRKDLEGASWAPRQSRVIGAENGAAAKAPPRATDDKAPAATLRAAALDSIRALMLIRAYRVRGHLAANLDPLKLTPPAAHSELDPKSYGFTEADYDRPIFIDKVLGLDRPTLRQIIQRVRETYCGTIGVEFMHIQESDQKTWIQERIEGDHNRTAFSAAEKKTILAQLTEAEAFERFLHIKYTGTKRFGLDGSESLIPLLEEILACGSALGVEEVVIGMPHRGRLNVLANFMGKPFAAIFSEFQGRAAKPDDVQGSGDVKYHLGTSTDREIGGRKMHLSLAANPSHLEAVDPVVVGKVRAKQRQRGDKERRRVLGLLMHGDAAFAGQGLVAETLGLSDIKGYRTGGTIHVIVNNQIGFTTAPHQSRSSPYPTEVAKMVQAPILHVNGDDVEAVVHAARIAIGFRHTFRKDVILDLWCYRRFGHNEGDEPGFTQPIMYKAIAKHQATREIYAQKLVAERAIAADEADAILERCRMRLEENFEASKTYKPNKADWLEGRWSHLKTAPTFEERRGKTDVPLALLHEVGAAIARVPAGFKVHPRIQRVLDQRRKSTQTGDGIDWATGEALAFGTLVCEGTLVRLSGQDCARGTFSQRHADLIEQDSGARHTPLANIRDDQARFVVNNSPLAEASVLGFEYGFALAEPNALIMWEAQFGDFVNGAQVIIDQFICSAESKWLRMSGLVMLLPHGFEGQGPEHSSARLERFLQLCAEDNLQVCNITTPANYFHALRRQINRSFRKPLVIMTPKSLLRHKLCVSRLDDMGPGTWFHRVLGEAVPAITAEKVRRVVLCSGKVYYDLLAEREKRAITDVALVRLEQLYPFPVRSLAAELARYKNATSIVWCQEEPKNMGAWTFADRRLEDVVGTVGLNAGRPIYAGRPEAASPATGLITRHTAEQEKLVAEALSV